MIIPSEIKYIIHQIRQYDGADNRYTQLNVSKFPEIILKTVGGKILKNIQPRELGFYLQLGKFGHANTKPSIWFFSNLDGKLAAIVYHWDINPPLSIDIKKDGAFVGVPEALASLNGIVNANHHSILESVNSDDITLVLPKLTGDYASDYCYNFLTSTIGWRGGVKILTGSDATHYFIKFGMDLNNIIADNFFEITSLQYMKIKHNGVLVTALDPLAANGSGPTYVSGVSSTPGTFDPRNIQTNVPFETVAWKAGDPGVLSMNFQVPKKGGATLAADYTITSNVAHTITGIVSTGTEWAFSLNLTAAVPVDGSGFVNFQDIAPPPPPAFDTTLTIDMVLAPGLVELRGTLGAAIDGIVHINRVFSDGFLPSGCNGAAIASAQQNNNNDIAIGATQVVFGSQITTGNWNLVGPNAYNIFNVNINGNPHLTGDIMTIGTKKVKIILHACS